jgi:predicted ester cyclase
MSKERNIAAQTRSAEIVAAGEFDRLGEVFAADVVDHDPASGQAPGVEGIKQFFRQFKASFPDLRMEIEFLTADEDYVTIVYRIAGTHQGDYMGIPPIGRHFEVRALQAARFENAMIVERWGSSDTLGILSQLGIPMPPHAS